MPHREVLFGFSPSSAPVCPGVIAGATLMLHPRVLSRGRKSYKTRFPTWECTSRDQGGLGSPHWTAAFQVKQRLQQKIVFTDWEGAPLRTDRPGIRKQVSPGGKGGCCSTTLSREQDILSLPILLLDPRLKAAWVPQTASFSFKNPPSLCWWCWQ